MDCATLFDNTMYVLWDNKNDDIPKEAIAVASYIKSHGRINHANAFDVIAVMWPLTRMHARLPEHDDGHATVLYDVTFPDESHCLITALDGIGSGIEL